MNTWIDLNALWKIVVLGLLAGAGLPAIFAVGLRALSIGAPPAGQGDSASLRSGGGAGTVAAAACFAVVLGGVGYGIYLVVAGS